MSEDAESQRDEVEALTAIYGDDFVTTESEAEGGSTYDIHISCDDVKWWAVTISIILPPSYPSSDAPIFQVRYDCLFLHVFTHSSFCVNRNTCNISSSRYVSK